MLEISGFDVDTAASGREGRSKLRAHQYHMVITDMRMESDAAGREVIQAARTAAYHPAVALLTAFPDDDWADIGADKMLVKPMQTSILIRQIEKLLDTHAAKLQRLANSAAAPSTSSASTRTAAPAKKKSAAKRPPTKKSPAKTPIARKKVATKKRKR